MQDNLLASHLIQFFGGKNHFHILGFEVIVDAKLVALGEAGLVAEVMVAKVVTVAGRLHMELLSVGGHG